MAEIKPYDDSITPKEFYIEACRYADSKSVQTAMKWWRAFNEVFVHQIRYRGNCKLPDVGTFGTKHIEESKQVQKAPDGKVVTYHVPERELPVFYPHDTFVNDINYAGVTKAYRKRLKRGELTHRDYEREYRAQSENGELSPQERDGAKEKFQELLELEKKKHKGKVEPENDE